MIHETIFRNNDIRGIYSDEITNELSNLIGKTYGTDAINSGNDTILVGHDNRESSTIINEHLIEGILSTGCNVVDLGLITSPMLYYARESLKVPFSIMITASHSPKEYNGFKMCSNLGVLEGKDIKNIYTSVINKKFITGSGEVKHHDISKEYIDLMDEKIKINNKNLKVVIDCGNGTGSVIAPLVFKRWGVDLIEIYCTSDPSFPNHHPDPFVEENNKDLKRLVLENNADIGIGFDGDADRIGIIDEKGRHIPIDLFMLFIWKNIYKIANKKEAIFDVKCSSVLYNELIKIGVTPKFIKTGHSPLKKAMEAGNYDFGGELSGHVCFNDDYYGFDDALYAAGRTLEILSNTGKPFSSFIENIDKLVTSAEILVPTKESNKDMIISKIKEHCDANNYNYIDIDGIRVLYDYGFALVRKSNTGPNITTRFESDTLENMEKIKKEFLNIIYSLNSRA